LLWKLKQVRSSRAPAIDAKPVAIARNGLPPLQFEVFIPETLASMLVAPA
jgi:hypothetical protein